MQSSSDSENSDTNSSDSENSDTSSHYTIPDNEEIHSIVTERYVNVLEKLKMPAPRSGTSTSKQVTNNDLLKAINENNQQMSKLREEVGSLSTRLEAAMFTIRKLETENIELKQSIQDNERRIAALENKKLERNTELQKLAMIEKWQEATERRSRHDKIILKGTAFSYEPENLKMSTINTLAELLKVTKERLKKSEFHLFGKEKKCILMTLSGHEDKIAIFKAVREEKPRNVSVNKFLTPAQATLMYELRKIKYEQKKFTSVFSLSGKICVTYTEGGEKKLINSLADI